MKRLVITKKLTLGGAGAAVVFVCLGILSAMTATRASRNSDWVKHTYEVLDHLETLARLVTSAEAEERGFLITGATHYNTTFTRITSEEIPAELGKIVYLTSDNPAQQARLEQVSALLNDRIADLHELMALRTEKGLDAVKHLATLDTSRNRHNNISVAIAKMVDHENELLLRRNQREKSSGNLLAYVIWSDNVIALLIVVALVSFFSTHKRRKKPHWEDESLDQAA